MVHSVETGLRSNLMRAGVASCGEGEMPVAGEPGEVSLGVACLREQPRRAERQPDRAREAKRLASKFGVERCPDPGGKAIHFFRTEPGAPTHCPSSAAERRMWLAARRGSR